jgi:flagellar motility protein MotE (MotC chaperone)
MVEEKGTEAGQGTSARRSANGRRSKELQAIVWALAAIAVGKIALGGWSLQESWAAKSPPMTSASTRADSALSAVAVAPPPGSKRGAGRGMADLLDSVTRRQAELEAREKRLGEREQQLALFEKDVSGKITELEKLEEQLQTQAAEAKASSQEAADSLAKVYAAMKPADAAPILDKLDDATVLRIFKGMRAKQIGEILPLMSADKAVLLTRSLAAG